MWNSKVLYRIIILISDLLFVFLDKVLLHILSHSGTMFAVYPDKEK